MFHIKPTADRADVFQFHSNFIRFFRQVREGTDKDSVAALTQGIGEETGIHETCENINGGIQEIVKRHTLACRAEVLVFLRKAAAELRIIVDK